ncbi:MAG: DNA translocase FtsK 4TM domain-containing protein, partial [Terriglobales bacterium]
MHPLRPTANRRFNEMVGLVLLVLATLLGLALLSYHPADPSWNTAAALGANARPDNWVGPVGATLADLLFQSLGLASFLLVMGLASLALRWFRAPRGGPARLSHVIGLALCITAVGTLLAELPQHWQWRSSAGLEGLLGTLLGGSLIGAFNPIGAYVITLTLLLVGVFLCTAFSFAGVEAWWQDAAAPRVLPRMAWLMRPFSRFAAWRQARAHARQLQRDEARIERKRRRPEFEAEPPPVRATFVAARTRPQVPESAAERARRESEAALSRQPEAAPVHVAPVLERAREAKPIRMAPGLFSLPRLDLLQEPAPGNQVEEEELRDMASRLMAKCEEFSVNGQVTQINPGPVVTTYEFKPQAGVKYNRITALNDDLCLALAAESIYIERIPGKSTVGIEVPNPHRETIYLREIIASSEFQRSKSPLTMALGKDANGQIVVSDLAAMPHLLIAGSTGSG